MTGKTPETVPVSLPQPLPPGFGAVGSVIPSKAPIVLSIRPVDHLDLASLHRAPFPPDQAKDIATGVADQPVPLQVHPLLVSRDRLRAGDSVTVVAGYLAKSPPHAVLFILQGEQLRAQRLVESIGGAAAGIVTLPADLPLGAWDIAVEDLSQLTSTPDHKIGGTITMGLGVLTVTS